MNVEHKEAAAMSLSDINDDLEKRINQEKDRLNKKFQEEAAQKARREAERAKERAKEAEKAAQQ